MSEKTCAQASPIRIQPSTELEFYGPFTKTQTSNIELSNLSKDSVAFKVKTTVPKRYCVRPVCGIIEPDQSAVVTVMLQPFEYEISEKNKHKFMIMTVPLTDFSPESDIDLVSLWKEIPMEKITDTRLKCILKMPNELLTIKPNKLIFESIPSKSSTVMVDITNTSARRICFKVRSNAPRRYEILPSEGCVLPRETKTIKVTSLPNTTPLGDDASQDKIIFVSTMSEEDSSDDTNKIWKMDKSEIAEHIIPCHINLHEKPFVMPSSSKENQKLEETINNLKLENAKLRESHDKLRRLGVDEMTFVTTPGDEATPFSRYGYVTLIFYLLLTFIIALLVGKFVL